MRGSDMRRLFCKKIVPIKTQKVLNVWCWNLNDIFCFCLKMIAIDFGAYWLSILMTVIKNSFVTYWARTTALATPLIFMIKIDFQVGHTHYRCSYLYWGGCTHMLRHTGMCRKKWVSFCRGVARAFMVLTTSFYDKNWKILMRKADFQNFSLFKFFIYKLCMIMCIDIAP